jgi:hypothetical protein
MFRIMKGGFKVGGRDGHPVTTGSSLVLPPHPCKPNVRALVSTPQFFLVRVTDTIAPDKRSLFNVFLDVANLFLVEVLKTKRKSQPNMTAFVMAPNLS